IELETRLQDPIGRISLAVTEASTYLLGDQKQSMPYLNSLPPEKRRKIQRLSFVEGRAGYYSLYDIMNYFQSLPALEFIEIQTEAGAFIALIPIDVFRAVGDISQAKVHDL